MFERERKKKAKLTENLSFLIFLIYRLTSSYN